MCIVFTSRSNNYLGEKKTTPHEKVAWFPGCEFPNWITLNWLQWGIFWLPEHGHPEVIYQTRAPKAFASTYFATYVCIKFKSWWWLLFIRCMLCASLSPCRSCYYSWFSGKVNLYNHNGPIWVILWYEWLLSDPTERNSSRMAAKYLEMMITQILKLPTLPCSLKLSSQN